MTLDGPTSYLDLQNVVLSLTKLRPNMCTRMLGFFRERSVVMIYLQKHIIYVNMILREQQFDNLNIYINLKQKYYMAIQFRNFHICQANI